MTKQSNASHPRVIGFATQGAGGDDEQRLRSLLSQIPDAELYAFDKGSKLSNTRRLIRLMLEERPDLVVMEGTGIAGGLALLIGSLLSKVPYVVSSGDAVGPFVAGQYPILGPLFTMYERLLYRRALGFIGWTPYLAGRALTYGTPFSMTAAGWAPFAFTEEERQAARSRIRSRYGIPEHHIVVGIVGSLSWNRRVGYCYGFELVKAMRQLQRQDVTVLIVGDGSGRSRLQELAAGHPGIILTGRVPREQVAAYLSAMDLASLPQSVDQVGSFRYTTKVSEYWAAQLPIVTGKIPMAYDLGQDWMIRLNGARPWEDTYIHDMRGLLEQLTDEHIQAWKARVPAYVSVFDQERQIRNVTEFVYDILEEAQSTSSKQEGRREVWTAATRKAASESNG
ncbi:glycosyltransferase [Paenibacillus sp. GD4]|jgi:glycosyltransferase involved in cell wall biosynthesis|uniref:glycosyltransferase n=1 Tax=Paenibacillus sp. GD4 TaxID=3068890 RepID=UPI00279691AA|nr:glycosyltransferase [Paenibacillus sp. GD4]MDQ1910395.1 glycosyltransferase [Paenibacillus sp. GD4]